MSNIKLEQISGVYQDCTCDYDVIFNDKELNTIIL